MSQMKLRSGRRVSVEDDTPIDESLLSDGYNGDSQVSLDYTKSNMFTDSQDNVFSDSQVDQYFMDGSNEIGQEPEEPEAEDQTEPETRNVFRRTTSRIRRQFDAMRSPAASSPKTVGFKSPNKAPADIPWNLREQLEDENVDAEISRVSSSLADLGLGVHRVFKGIGNTNRKLIFYMIMFFSTCSLFLQKYAVYYLTRPSKKQARRGGRPKKVTPKSPLAYFVYTVNTIAFLFLLWKTLYHFEVTFDLRSVGMTNCNEVTFPPASRLHAWHIQPPKSTNLTLSEVLYRGLPIILHLRHQGTLGEQHRVNVLKSLAANNFHVLAPVSPLSDLQTIKIWEHLAKVSNNSVYTWFDHSDVSTIKKLASTMCDQGHQPSGIIMETKKMANIRFHSMEIWSSACKAINGETPETFKFLKCPTSWDGLNIDAVNEDVGSCLRTMDPTTVLAA